MDYNIKTIGELLSNPSKIEYREYPTGHPGLDDMLTINTSLSGIRTSRLYTILGCTGSGKSLFMLNLSYLLANSANVLYISLENTEDQTLDRLAGLNVSDTLFLSHPTKNPNFGLNDGFYVDDVKNEITEVKKKYGKDIAKELNIAIITASQCNREALKTYKMATNKQEIIKALCNINESHVSDSAKIIHISDFVWFVHRIKKISFESFLKGKENPALFISVLKNRDFSSNIDKMVIPYRANNELANHYIDLTMEV